MRKSLSVWIKSYSNKSVITQSLIVLGHKTKEGQMARKYKLGAHLSNYLVRKENDLGSRDFVGPLWEQ